MVHLWGEDFRHLLLSVSPVYLYLKAEISLYSLQT